MSPLLICLLALCGLLVWSIVRPPGKTAPKSSEYFAIGCLCWLLALIGTPFVVTAMFQAEWFGQMKEDAAVMSGALFGVPAGFLVGFLLNFGTVAFLKKRSPPPPE